MPTKEDLKAIQLPVAKKLGEGGCGVVYEVANAKTPHVRAALKSEPFGMHEDDELLKMEVYVLRKLPNGRHVCRLLATGKVSPNFTFVVMTLLGPALHDLRRLCPERRFSFGTTVLLGVECVEAVRELHEAGFVHRDVKPFNFSLGRPPKQRLVFLYDFGLARQILTVEKGVEKLREPRRTVSFKGTVRYSSLNVHRLECGRHDDLWSLMYSLIEMLVGELPWQRLERAAAEKSKEANERLLIDQSPVGFAAVFNHLKRLNYAKKPGMFFLVPSSYPRVDYAYIRSIFEQILKKRQVAPTAPFDWEAGGRHADVFKAGGPKPNERTKATDLKRVCDNRTKCEVTDIGERKFARPTEEDTGAASLISGVFANDDALFNVQKIHKPQ